MPTLTPEEIRRWTAQGGGRTAVIVCRRWRSGPVYQCRFCEAEVEATPVGSAQIETGAWVACNDCGIVFADMAANIGKLEGVAISPHCEESFAKAANPPLAERIDLLRISHPFKRTEE